MTVLEQHPGSLLDSLLDHPDRDGSLTLTQGQRVELGASETLQTVSHALLGRLPCEATSMMRLISMIVPGSRGVEG